MKRRTLFAALAAWWSARNAKAKAAPRGVTSFEVGPCRVVKLPPGNDNVSITGWLDLSSKDPGRFPNLPITIPKPGHRPEFRWR
ncbi:hypothetical protein LCGC14_0320010 [marine sediment metagenome]|uniref:Uncharacterized protein n=1 Tax=marine sediment metagenome TaxID=412755 RepID=A0A0F9WRK9_9ZZZZ